MKTVIEVAREAGAIHIHKSPKEFALVGNEAIERFAALIRANEREACAKVCEELQSPPDWNLVAVLWKECRSKLAAAIRSRSSEHGARGKET